MKRIVVVVAVSFWRAVTALAGTKPLSGLFRVWPRLSVAGRARLGLRVAAKRAASNKRGAWRALAVLVPVLLLAAGLVIAAPDSTPTAEAHQIECKSGDIGCFAYNYVHTHPKPTPKPTPDCQRDPSVPGCARPTPTPKPTPDCQRDPSVPGCARPTPTPKPVGCPDGMHEHWPFGCHNKVEDHTKTVPTPKPCALLHHRHSPAGACHWTLKECNGSHIDHDATCPPKPTDPPKTDPPKTDPPKTDPPKTDPPKTDPPKTDPPKTDPPTVDPPKTDPPKTDPPTVDPPKTDPPTVDPPPSCGAGKHRHGIRGTSYCHDNHPAEPVCGTANAGQTVTWTAHTSAGGHTQKSKVCPAGPNTGNCTPGNVPDGQHPHTRRGETFCHADHPCPAGYQTLATLPTTVLRPRSNEEAKVATEQQIKDNPSMANYAVYQQRLDAAHDCYRLVYPEILESDFDLLGVVIDGVTWFYKEGEKFVENGVEYVVRNGKRAIEVAADYILSAAEQAAKAAADAAIKANNLIHSTLCTFTGAAAVIVISAGKQYVAAQSAVGTVATAVTAAAATKAIVVTAVVALAIAAYCTFVPDTRSDDSDSNNDDDSDPEEGSVSAPAWALTGVPYATLSDCTDNAGSGGCGYDSGKWYVDSRGADEP